MPKKTTSKKKPKRAGPKKKPKSGKKSMGKSGRCWNGYKPTPGKKAFSKGSCMKSS